MWLKYIWQLMILKHIRTQTWILDFAKPIKFNRKAEAYKSSSRERQRDRVGDCAMCRNERES